MAHYGFGCCSRPGKVPAGPTVSVVFFFMLNKEIALLLLANAETWTYVKSLKVRGQYQIRMYMQEGALKIPCENGTER